MKQGKGKVLLAMSGGVDSSVAAALLQRDGYEVVGCFMRLGSPGQSLDELQECDVSKIRIGHQGCCSINDAKDAQLVAAHLDIPFYVVNFKKDFGRIIDYFVDEYNAGRTPNPCVRCNDWLKYGRLSDYARSIDADYVATGHYARIDTIDGQPALLRGVDESKDQSYVLFGSPLEKLSHMLLPVGGFRKDEIRAMAQEMGLPVFDKPDSQEICFVPDNDYAGLVRKRTPDQFAAGEIQDTEGNVIGTHEGHQHFTIGQRRGIKVALGYPIYVVNKDANTNRVTVGSREDLMSGGLIARQVNWLIDPPREPLRCQVMTRYNSALARGSVQVTGEDELRFEFDEPQSSVAPGQAAVCYDGGRVLGGGWIERAVH